MRIIFITSDDYANFGFYKSEALKSTGIDSESFILQSHPFNYDKHSTLVDTIRMKEEIYKADIIHIVHSDVTALRLCEEVGKPYYVWHTGTRFRQSPNQYNNLFKNAKGVFYALGEFENLCNGKYFSVTVDTDSLPFDLTYNYKRFAHYPSNADVKGTDNIIRMISQTNADLEYSKSQIGYLENLQRINLCDCYIEMFNLKQGGRPYGSFGTTAIECASMGKIVITNSLYDEHYINHYGAHPMLIANTEDEFKEQVNYVLGLSLEKMNDLKMEHRDWAIKKHGYKATANRLIQYL